MIRSAKFSGFCSRGKGRGEKDRGKMVEKAAKRRQEVEIAARRRGEKKTFGKTTEDGAGSGTTPPRAVCTIFFASRQRRPESRSFLG